MLQDADIVDVTLPSKADAVKMLLSVAGLSPENPVQEAFEVVKFCDRLPLAIAPGKLVQEMELQMTGLVSRISQEEFTDSGQDITLAERMSARHSKQLQAAP